MSRKKMMIAVLGGHTCDTRTARLAQRLGAEIAKLGAIVVCGGLGGVMEAVAKGAKRAKGVTVGILPSEDKKDANQYIDIAITTGMGYTRNTLVVGSADIVVALPGKYGTLSEIAFALNAKKPVISLGSWNIDGAVQATSVAQAIQHIKQCIKKVR